MIVMVKCGDNRCECSRAEDMASSVTMFKRTVAESVKNGAGPVGIGMLREWANTLLQLWIRRHKSV